MSVIFLNAFCIFFSLSLQQAGAIDCKYCRNRDPTDRKFKPQECYEKCKGETMDDDDNNELIEALSQDVATMKILVIVLLVIVVTLLLFLVMVLSRNLIICPTIALLKKKHRKEKEIEKNKEEIANTEAGRIANYSSQHSPYGPQRTSSFRTSQVPSVHLRSEVGPRKRTPSESTCPDESQLEGYDNLGLSSSTLNYHSRPGSPVSPSTSTPSSPNTGGMVSLETLNTTMTTVRLDSSIPESPK